MNLINDEWIPIRRKSGLKEKIAPWQITDKYAEDPIIELAAVRPDFNGALIQFLIGILQTTCAPRGSGDWRKWLNDPPSPNEFKGKFETVADAFNLDGGGPRFMQDLTIENDEHKIWNISKLFPGFPGVETENDNTDLFIKSNSLNNLCIHCSATAIFMAQSYARSGGAGWRQGLRGSNPVTSIIKGDSLWKTSWLNVIGRDQFLALGNIGKDEKADKFPWIEKTKTSENDEQVFMTDVHPSQIFWQIPWRIRIIIKQKQDFCDVCGESSEESCGEFLAKNYGVNYKGGWKHPLTPYSCKVDEPQNIKPVTISAGGVGYRHWMGLVLPSDKAQPSLVVQEFFNRMHESAIEKIPLWVFGYDMKKDKARCWYESVMPVVFIEDEQKWKVYCADMAMLIRAAEAVSNSVSKAVVKALNVGVFNAVRKRFWQETESEFYKQIEVLRQTVLGGPDTVSVRQTWHAYLVKKAFEIFNDMSQADMIELVDAKRVARAQNELWENLDGKKSEKLKVEILGLP